MIKALDAPFNYAVVDDATDNLAVFRLPAR